MMLTIVVCTALALIIVSTDLSWSNLVSATRNDLVFEGRLKEYGAYQLRKENPRNLVVALFLTIGLALGAGYAAVAAAGTEKVVVKTPHITPPELKIIPLDITPPKKDDDKKLPARKIITAAKPIAQKGLATVDVTTAPVHATTAETRGGTPDGEETGDIITPTDPDLPGTGTGNGNGGEEPVVHDFSQIAPSFPGGDEALYSFLYSNINYSQNAIQNNYQGTVYVSFVVDAEGNISAIKIVRGIEGASDLDRSVIQAIRKMPQWIPGKNGGKPVAVRQSIPVKFILR